MTRILHLSDLHLGASHPEQPALLDALVQALRGPLSDLLVFTGDVFDSTHHEPQAMVRRFVELLDRIEKVTGTLPTLVLPGNHDRREGGVLTPLDPRLFEALQAAVKGRRHVRVLGCRTPFLAEYIDLPGFPFHLVSYDSTYLPTGWLSAGGVLRQEDLLQVAENMLDAADTRPVVFLVHHHLVPTPVTDVGDIDTTGKGSLVNLVVRHVLPRVVANADREELTMTALGAGTALSTLHGLGRAVMVLHGHKHYPTARLLKGLAPEEGDLLLLGAGSCGTSESWHPSPNTDAPRLWPSFNRIEFDGSTVRADSLAFPPEVGPEVWEGRPRVNRRPLVDASLEGRHWNPHPEAAAMRDFTASVAVNRSTVTLTKSAQYFDRYDVLVKRELRLAPQSDVAAYQEVVRGPKRARLVERHAHDVDRGRLPVQLEMPLTGSLAYLVEGGACATVAEASKEYGLGTAFESVSLFVRYRTEDATLVLEMPPVDPSKHRPFASVTDLTTGRERAVALGRDDAARVYTVSVKHCPARTLLRIWWPLEN